VYPGKIGSNAAITFLRFVFLESQAGGFRVVFFFGSGAVSGWW